ncbi:unnamed protein product [Arabidopsis thaliana]|jgi:hypothetical protein|uniref:(thale cress) hypothetical protein n=1 Tax=Arabidopsis thaliana TaxID=3702 RepID=A0A7G2EGF2_ARATH|nr:unnamed protein product [Arabidopsis thaliana]
MAISHDNRVRTTSVDCKLGSANLKRGLKGELKKQQNVVGNV